MMMMIGLGGSVEVPDKVREDVGSVSVEEVRVWSCVQEESWLVRSGFSGSFMMRCREREVARDGSD